MAKIRVEFSVNIENDEDLMRINKSLAGKKGIELVFSDIQSKTILLEFDCSEPNAGSKNDQVQPKSIHQVQDELESETGIVTVVKGLGNLSSAVSELAPHDKSAGKQIRGIARLAQLSNNFCFVDASIDVSNINPNSEFAGHEKLLLAIHEYGDLGGTSFEFIGEPIVDIEEIQQVTLATDKSLSIRKVIPNCNVMEIIGKSIALRQIASPAIESNDGHSVLGAGVIARAATVQTNRKQICSCSGKTIWQERVERKIP